MTFLTDLETRLEADARAVEGAIVAAAEWLGEEVVTLSEQFIQQFSSVAISAILAEAPKAITGEEKFGNAVTHVYSQAVGKGLEIVIADAQLLVQSAFKKVQQVAAGQP